MSAEAPRPELRSLLLGDPPERWRELGFAVDGPSVRIGAVELRLGAQRSGIAGWGLTGLTTSDELERTSEIDGLPTELLAPTGASDASLGTPPPPAPPEHPNGATGVDHVVVTTPDFDRTAQALERAGMPLRRIREAPGGLRQGFRRLGPVILELVEARDAAAGPARFWGVVVIVADLDALASRLGDRLGAARDAVQPGRRIATLRPSAGLGEAVAFMSPEP